jgi:hypothetical protein
MEMLVHSTCTVWDFADTVPLPQDPQWMPKATDSTKPYMYCFPHAYIPMVIFNYKLGIVRLIVETNNKIEQS